MNSKCLNSKSDKGFTLIEVMISMAVLVFISLGIYQATIETYRLRDILGSEGDFYNSIRLATTIIQRDIALIYTPTIAQPEGKQKDKNEPVNAQQMGAIMSDDLGQSTVFWAAALDETGLRPSHFIGTDTKMSFVSTSHIRIYKDSPESEFAKISYELKRDSKESSDSNTLVLVKTESPNAFATDETRDQYRRSYELLHGIRKLSYTYLKRDGNTWKTFRSWDSDKDENKNSFPDIIEMRFEVVGPKKEVFEGFYKFRPEIPLNGLNPSS